jgi:hypothetical protein
MMISALSLSILPSVAPERPIPFYPALRNAL